MKGIENLKKWVHRPKPKVVEVNSFVVYDSDLGGINLSDPLGTCKVMSFIKDHTCGVVVGDKDLRFPENSEVISWYEPELGRICYEQKIFEEVV